MNINKFLLKKVQERAVLMPKQDKKDWDNIKKALINKQIDKDFIRLCLEKAVENDLDIEKIKLLFEYSQENKNHPDLYKWACAFCELNTIEYLEENMTYKNISSAATAAICHYRKDVLVHMLEKKYPILTEANFCMAILRSGQLKKNFIIHFFKNNIESIKDLSSYSIECIKGSWMLEDIQLPQTKQYAENLIKLIEATILKTELTYNLEPKTNKIKHKI